MLYGPLIQNLKLAIKVRAGVHRIEVDPKNVANVALSPEEAGTRAIMETL